MDKNTVTTPFCSKVYQLTSRIPKGKVTTYGQIAKLAGNPLASRAVGRCLSENKNTIKVPCHRVVSKNGRLTGYAFGGVAEKKKMLINEGVKFKNEKVDMSSCLFEF